MTAQVRGRFARLGVGYLLLAGCGAAFGPETMATVDLAGRVHYGDRPIGPCWLEFLPIEGTIGRLRSAAVGADGTFRADRVPVGKVAIRLVGRLPRTGGDPGYDAAVMRAQGGFALRREIEATATRLDLDLLGPWRTPR